MADGKKYMTVGLEHPPKLSKGIIPVLDAMQDCIRRIGMRGYCVQAALAAIPGACPL